VDSFRCARADEDDIRGENVLQREYELLRSGVAAMYSVGAVYLAIV
jgi:hypothetical protein